MVDGKVVLNESRPAAAYLVNKYGKDDKLYPKDPDTRAMVDQMLYFDMGVLYKAYGEVMVRKPNSLFIQSAMINCLVFIKVKCYIQI